MKLIVCVDKNNGLSFNHRRQSRDRIVTQDIVRCAPVRSAPASASLFADYPGAVIVSEDFLTAAKPGEWCFAELLPLPEYIETMDEAVSYFEDYEYRPYYPSAYDCTGQAFTSWYKVFVRGGRFWAYHRVSVDV